jgi:hypothetical protein
MFHPLSEDLNQYSIAQLETKLSDLRKKYFQSRNSELRQQIGVFVEVYDQELKQRLAAEQLKMAKETGKDLDNLINID